MFSLLFCFCFFFQAEDGIRDGHVTGVQTCALPISLDYVAGGCCVLDQTAEDLLQLDSRMLTLSKNFPGFFSYGPDIVSLDELGPDGLDQIQVSTCLNGSRARTAAVAEMRFSPAALLAFI